MVKKKSTQLPFLFIAIFSLMVMAAILLAQSQSNKSIRQLKTGNTQAVSTIQVGNVMAEIINEIYIIESDSKNFITSGKPEFYTNTRDAYQKLNTNIAWIEKLATTNTNSGQEVKTLSALVARKIEPLQSLKPTSTATEKIEKLSLLTTASGKMLTDSIYASAVDIQLKLEAGLQKTITDNEVLSERVLLFSRILGIISILAIAILASIIIRRLVQNYQLIKALRLANLQTEKESHVKEQFLSNMSHEIRTPVNSVIGFTNLLEKTEMKEEQQQFVGLIKTAGQNLLGIINDILDISKIEAGMMHFAKNPFNLEELCYTVEMMFFHRISEKNLVFESEISADIPPIIIGDKERLTQVLINLLNNAIKFTKEGGVTLKIELVTNEENAVLLRFSVKDTGIGIMPDKLERIFDRFVQAEADTTRSYGGTGLGLSIVKSIITMQGGSITAKSEPGKGSEFIFEMLFGIGEEDIINRIKTENKKTIPVGDNKTLKNVKVLAAEDNKMNQMLLKFIFQQWDLKYELAETGQQAIEMLQKDNFDLVLMDIQMPVMDGYAAAQVIRNELRSEVPIIAMTANVLPGEKEKCKQLGMNDYVSKPLNENILYDLLVKYLSPAAGTSGNATVSLIDLNYLNRIYGSNPGFIKELILQFQQQYPAEVDTLHDAVKKRDINKVKLMSHHMKTTLSSLNNKTPLIDHLQAMEIAENTPSDWEMIQHKMAIMISSKQAFISEANIVLQHH